MTGEIISRASKLFLDSVKRLGCLERNPLGYRDFFNLTAGSCPPKTGQHVKSEQWIEGMQVNEQ